MHQMLAWLSAEVGYLVTAISAAVMASNAPVQAGHQPAATPRPLLPAEK